MKQLLLLFLFVFAFQFIEVTAQNSINIIPHPQKLIKSNGTFILSSNTSIYIYKTLQARAAQLRNYLGPALGFELPISNQHKANNFIQLMLNKNLIHLGEEGYQLSVNKNNIKIVAFHEKGILWGIQTLRQLLPTQVMRQAKVNNQQWTIPFVNIEDKPRFSWRGLMLDCSRTFIPKEQIKKYIEVLSFYKMSVLHMHLTDDQGWRLEIKKYPALTEISSKFHPSFDEPKEYQGFYTQDDIREIIAFASQRNIMVVPEIEMPGHTTEVFAAFPNLACNLDTFKIRPWFKSYGLKSPVFCAGNDETFVFLQNILDEVIGLFPSTYIHIGGDEAPKMHWKVCPKCQKRMVDQGLKNENELQSWFVKKIERYINSKGKKLIGWDEIIEGGLSKTATVMYWRNWQKDIAQKIPSIPNDLIMSPTSHSYFDYGYDKISTEKIYHFNPAPDTGAGLNQHKVLGVQANFWSHLDKTSPRIDQQLFPRLLAMAEIAWTEDGNKDWNDFSKRLNLQLLNLNLMGVNYFKEQQ